MCGRFTLSAPERAIEEEFAPLVLPFEYRPRYNIAPTQEVLAVVAGDDGPGFTRLRWGLIPAWTDDPAIGNRMINARGETAAAKPSFRSAFRRRRCWVLADGFYEWQRTNGRKQPVRVRLATNRPFVFAGLWEEWRGRGEPGLEPIRSCAIITTEANPYVRAIHDRMPVILRREDRERWLDPSAEPASLQPLLAPYAGDDLAADPVSTLVNSPRNDVPECIEPLATPA